MYRVRNLDQCLFYILVNSLVGPSPSDKHVLLLHRLNSTRALTLLVATGAESKFDFIAALESADAVESEWLVARALVSHATTSMTFMWTILSNSRS